MESLSVPKTLSFESGKCQVRTGIWEPHILASEADDVVAECSPDAENHVSCMNPDRDAFISDVGGLEWSTVLGGNEMPGLPRFIPVVEKSFLWMDPAMIPCSTVGISLADVFTTSMSTVGGRLQAPGKYRLNYRIFDSPVFKAKDMVLIMSGRDLMIETLWMRDEGMALFKELGQVGFTAATSPNFSVFIGECPLGHAINQKKSLECARLLEEAGITPIPHIYAMSEPHLQRYVKYLQEHPKVRMVIMNCTLQRKVPTETEHIRKVITRLITEVGSDLHIILQGLNIKNAALLCDYAPNLHYSVSTPFRNAVFRNENIFDPEMRDLIRIPGSSIPKDELVAANVHAYTQFVHNICPLGR